MMDDGAKLTRAVALRYDRGNDGAPRVVAGGQGEVALHILELAREAGVHVTEDTGLLELLARVPLGSEIPAELYQAVAEVLSFVYQLNKEVNIQ
ncbi:MAG: EscU/YscU/HrcU family type III secretion system export apparatus switch protein [Desulfobacterales bacterium]|nr:EscU/YscU/HrcU family type III secretion system export apparatus switch protein [Desulfobacterales bacterium]